MQDKSLPKMIERHPKQTQGLRFLSLKVTAALVLVAFTTMVLHGNWILAVVLLGGGMGVWKLYEENTRRRERLALLQDVESMTEGQFVPYVTELLRAQGYGVLQARQGDARRADLFLMMRGDESVACRFLRYPVTVAEITKTQTAMRLHGCRRAMVMTSSRVTLAARYVARRSGCVVMDRYSLVHLISQYRQGHRVYAFRKEETSVSARRNG